MKKDLCWHYGIAGAILGFSFLHEFFWSLGIVALFLWFVALSKNTRLSDAWWGGWIFGTLKMLFVLSWFWAAYPLSWMNIHPAAVAFVLIGAYWLITSVVIGLGFAGASVFAHLLLQKKQNVARAVLLAGCVVLAEVLGSLLFSVYTLGPGSSINTNFSFGYVGYLLNSHGFLRLAAMWGGVYTLSFVAAMIAYAGYAVCCVKNKKTFVTAVVLCCVLVVCGYVPTTYYPAALNTGVVVALVSTSFPTEVAPNPITTAKQQAQLSDALAAGSAYIPDYIVLPEAAQYVDLRSATSTFGWARLQKPGAILIDSARVDLPDGTARVRAMVLDSKNNSILTADKQYLVPQGEYVPYFYRFVFTLLGNQEFFNERTGSSTYVPGAADEEALWLNTVPGVLFCSESISPTRVLDLRKQRAMPFVAHPVSHSWFSRPYILWNETRTMVSLQALSSRIPIAQAGNMAPTLMVDTWGREMVPVVEKKIQKEVSVSVYKF